MKNSLLFAAWLFACLVGQAQTRIACIGASITAGSGVENPGENAYPGQLQSLLGPRSLVLNFGVSGTTLLKKGNFSYWGTSAYREALESRPDIVFIDLGGNDAKAVNRPYYDELEQDCRDMIRSFKDLPSHPRVLLLLPTAFFVTDRNGIYDPVCRNEVVPRLQRAASAEGVEVIDLHPLYRDRPDWVPDGIHPNEQGASLIAKRMFQAIGSPDDSAVDFPMVRKYDSYKGLVMAGYQGWFSCPGDGSDRGWYHYFGRNERFQPGNCSIDMWPDVSEYKKTYRTGFTFADGSPAYVMSEYDESTVETHFRWMREYAVDGVFVQRFVAEIKRPKSYRQLNKVWKSALHAANANNRAIAVMYDLSGMSPGDEQLVLTDIDALAAQYDIRERRDNPAYLHHNGKPLVAVWGVGFNDRRKYGFKEAEIIIDALIERGYSLLIGVPTHWREMGGDTLDDPELHRLIKKCDIVMPWFVGRYNEQTFPRFEPLVKGDMEWCRQHNLDYAPLAFPGFSWVNMNKRSKPIPRNRGRFYWKQLSSHIEQGAEMLYLAMFDEMDEGTAIFKCAVETPVGKSAFLPLDADLGSDYYLVLAGRASRKLREALNAAPPRVAANPIPLNYRFQFDAPSRREAADPVCEYFNGKYYLFASKSGGYWSSDDLAAWTYIPCTSLPIIENYAPTVLVWNNRMYYFASGSQRIFHTADPAAGRWEELLPSRIGYSVTDPAFFHDRDTGKVYLYWGCSDKEPIFGVEVDPADGFRPVGTPEKLIDHRAGQFGWEVPGNRNEENRSGWNEGPSLLQYKNKYYLQYAAPGTEYRTYADAAYVADHPLGPFTPIADNPFSLKPGGFAAGAGHGHSFQDKYGNYWRVATVRIAQRHPFERRLALFPLAFDAGDQPYTPTVWGDYPFVLPNRKIAHTPADVPVPWNLLSFGKPAAASSSCASHPPCYANNEAIENYWAAQTGDAGEWWQVDLGKCSEVHALQINFADHDFTVQAPDTFPGYQYTIESSTDGIAWSLWVDRSRNSADLPHELVLPEAPRIARFLRITNSRNIEGKFSLSGFRVFGHGNGARPSEVTGIRIDRSGSDRRRIALSWDPQANATGYIVRWGTHESRLNNAVMTFAPQFEAGFFHRDPDYFFSVEAFNESGGGGAFGTVPNS
ncbi:MAG: GDSL-type esterase/lipase family protein [Dysgonamonadaceae bacterium]|jgi:lysophospholipase L1-like esterase|nr:GDSL-type esterase/lipase family protein [Dysgonamonadaceae bacterium]